MKRFIFFKSTIDRINKLKDDFLSFLKGKFKSQRSPVKEKTAVNTYAFFQINTLPGDKKNIRTLQRSIFEEKIIIKMNTKYIAPPIGIIKAKDLFTDFCTKDLIKGL